MKKIIKHLRKNWIRHGFETLAVLIGVLAAFSLNNWYENRKARKQELVVLKELKEEFKYNRAELENFFEYLDGRIQPARALYKLYDRDSREVSIDELDSLFVVTILYYQFQVGQSVLTEVISSGRLSLIQNDNLRYLLTGWPGILDKAKMEDNLTYSFIEEEIFRYSLDHVSWRNTDKYDETMRGLQQGNSKLKPDNRSILESFEMENRIGQLNWYFENTRRQYTTLGEQMDEIIEVIEIQLNPRD